MDDAAKGIVKKLREWAGDLAKVAGNKWKRMSLFMSEKRPSLTFLEKVPHMRKNLNPLRQNLSSQATALVFARKENAMLAQHIEILDLYHKNG